ncbi:MAG: hypothetical protein WCR20_22065 [Verrucomicrobiota bacterium]
MQFALTNAIWLVLILYWVSIHLYVIVKRRPLFLKMKWTQLIISLVITPLLIFMVMDCLENPSLFNIPIILFCLVIIVWAILKRPTVTVFGLFYYDFLHEFIECLKDKKIEYIKSGSGIKTKNPEMEVSIFGESATIRLKNKSQKKEFSEFVSELKMRQLEGNVRNAYSYLIIWILVIAVVAYITVHTLLIK